MSSRPLPDHRPPQKPFHCALCSKSYARIHEYEAHENSYDHQHKKRFQEMKAMQRPTKRSAAEEDDGGVRKIAVEQKKPVGKGGFKKAGFRSAFAPTEEKKKVEVMREPGEKTPEEEEEEGESTDDEVGYEVYDPARPTS